MISEGPSKILVLGDKPRIAARLESEQHDVTLFGSPTNVGQANADIESAQLRELASDPTRRIRRLNGEFVVLIETADEIVIGNDRFSALPVFYMVEDGKLVLTFSYQAIWRRLKDQNKLKLDKLAFFEFLHFQRLFGETTLDEATKVLPPASLLTLSKETGAIKISRYWNPDFTKRTDGLNAIATDLADAVKASVARKTADAANVSLLLSGGMDSRVVLGGFSKDNLPLCVTIGEVENNEVDVARSLANIAGADHSFVQRSTSHYADTLTDSALVGGSMYMFQHGHFFGLDMPDTDLILHGHGFDYLFQGMYLPSTRQQILGRRTRSWALDPIGPDLAGEYTRKAKYKLKGIDPSTLLKSEFAAQANDKIRADIESVLGSIEGVTAEPYDDWDFVTTSAPGRHYTYLNLLSASSIKEQRTIAFDNDIFDIYYSTPAKVRHGTRLLAETIRQLNPDLLKVRNANTNLRPDLTPTQLTVKAWARGAKRRLGFGGSLQADPSVSDRSWPTGDSLLRNSQALRDRVDELRHSEHLESIGIFDSGMIRTLIDDSNSGNDSVATALLTLITIDEFLRSAI